MGSIEWRLRRLEAEEFARVPDFPDWHLTDQLYDALDSLRSHRITNSAQLATDREIHNMGLLCAYWELPGGVGEYSFPSGVSVTWIDNGDGSRSVTASEYIRVEDLPDGVREHFERMEPERQAKRDLWIYEMRDYFAQKRRQAGDGHVGP